MNRVPKAIATCVAALSFATAAEAQTVTGSDVDSVMSLARLVGTAQLQTQTSGAPKITGEIDGVTYQVFFLNCTDNQHCEDLNFYAGFRDNKQPLENMNAWNKDNYFTKAYLDSDLDAIIEMDVNLENGVTRGNLESLFRLWASELDRYTRYIGFK